MITPTPADNIALWASDATGPLQFLLALVGLVAFVSVGIKFARTASRNV